MMVKRGSVVFSAMRLAWLLLTCFYLQLGCLFTLASVGVDNAEGSSELLFVLNLLIFFSVSFSISFSFQQICQIVVSLLFKSRKVMVSRKKAH